MTVDGETILKMEEEVMEKNIRKTKSEIILNTRKEGRVRVLDEQLGGRSMR